MLKGSNIGKGLNAISEKSGRPSCPALQHKKNKSAASYQNADELPCIMNSSDAVKKHYAQGEASDMNEVLARAGLKNYQVVYYTPGIYEQLIDWLMQPFMSLMLVLLLGLAVRLQRNMPFPGPATFLLLATLSFFFVPLYQGGLSRWEEILGASFLAIGSAVFTKEYRLLRYMPVLLVATLSLCQSGSLHAQDFSANLLKLLLTGCLFATGWLIPFVLTKISVLRFRTLLPSRVAGLANS
jgi:hypothetical protein